MRKMKTLMVMLSIAMLLVVIDCKKDNSSSSGSSKFTVGSTSYALTSGYIEDDSNSAYIALLSSGLNISGENMTGSGNMVFLEIYPATAGSYAGTYTFNTNSDANTYSICEYDLNFRNSSDTYMYDYAGITLVGTITITKSGSNYVISIPSCSAYSTAYGSNTPTATTFSLSYNGTLTSTSTIETIGKMIKFSKK